MSPIVRPRLPLSLLAFAAAYASLLSPVQAQGQPQPIPQFAGALTEGFESLSTSAKVCYPPGVFSGSAELCAPSGPNLYVGGGSSCSCTTCAIAPYSGTLMCGTSLGALELRFDANVTRFGGQFATFGTGAVLFSLYDIDDRLVHTGSWPSSGGCAWTWFGWDLSALPPIRRVFLQATTNQIFFPNYVALDELQLDYAPPSPTPFCPGGSTTSGCVATISADANPKVGHGASCQVTVSSVEGRRRGSLFYGLARQDVPWCTGGLGTSRLCIAPTIVQTGLMDSGGTTGLCDGALTLDWSAYQIAHPGSIGSPWIAGEVVYAQAWFRDPPACRSMNLSGALELVYQP